MVSKAPPPPSVAERGSSPTIPQACAGWRMLPAVGWPPSLFPELLEPARQHWSQWQLLKALLASHSAQALISTGSGVFDVDTLADHQRARQRLQST